MNCKKSEATLRAIVDNSAAIICLKDLRGRYLLINKQFEKLFHVDRKTVLGQTAQDVFPLELANQFRLNDLRVIETGMPHEFEEKAMLQDGVHTYLSVKFPLFDRQRMIYAVGCVSTDITHQKRIHQILEHQANQLQQLASIVECSNDAIIGKSLDGNILSWNPEAERIYGYTFEEMKGKHISTLFPPEKFHEVSEIIEKVKRGEQVARYETVRLRKDGIPVEVSVTVSPIKDSAGAIVGYSTISHDVAERKKLEAAEKTELLLQEIQHRFKNHLQILSSVIALQSAHAQDERTRQLFKENQNRIQSMALLHEKLTLTKETSLISLGDYLFKISSELFRSFGINEDAVRLKVDADEVLFPIDTALPCGFIVNELVSNSLKYAFPDGVAGEIEIRLRHHQDCCILSVHDNGVGLPEELNLDKTTTLGLKLVRSLTKQINGTLEVHRNAGTTFLITLREADTETQSFGDEEASPRGENRSAL